MSVLLIFVRVGKSKVGSKELIVFNNGWCKSFQVEWGFIDSCYGKNDIKNNKYFIGGIISPSASMLLKQLRPVRRCCPTLIAINRIMRRLVSSKDKGLSLRHSYN